MERAEWLLLMNIKCKLLAMAGGFTRAIAQALFPEVLFPNFCTSSRRVRRADPHHGSISVKLGHVSLFIPTSPLLGRVSIAPARRLRSSLALPGRARIVPAGGTRSAPPATGV